MSEDLEFITLTVKVCKVYVKINTIFNQNVYI